MFRASPLRTLARTASRPADGGRSDRQLHSILVAEDNVVNQRVVSLMLAKLGYSPDVVPSGTEALERCESHAYDIILMDCQMPEMDGYEATRAIRAGTGTRGHTPDHRDDRQRHAGDREKCLAAGMDDYLAKPLTLDMLADKLRDWSPSA